MKHLLTFLAFSSLTLTYGQAYSGKGDQKFQLGANLQDHASGIVTTYDHGLGENISLGIGATYLLSVDGDASEFEDEFDLRARFNANIANVIGIEEKLDIYPGLNLGLRNFGGHLGARYFFTKGFGLFSEFSFPIKSYDGNPEGYQKLNNQAVFYVGASFNL
ncbi:hypothetical protein FLJC2902T_12160 [Flavobacterium limnosediminis JC2902]|uniref:Outer membrane protein beta-barrel domain-containing protein n=1 Tax=Flavobacterium limnosediminis JC2902 TaxID=1341181 RepID=V6SRW1_9FLAO|nr:DUF6646 family protein [Flavobacterium limnosediminis]ESU29174.1 hypothetical protein FLJC2902T_12160 [Flavobacterium limnosediminis JC2902]